MKIHRNSYRNFHDFHGFSRIRNVNLSFNEFSYKLRKKRENLWKSWKSFFFTKIGIDNMGNVSKNCTSLHPRQLKLNYKKKNNLSWKLQTWIFSERFLLLRRWKFKKTKNVLLKCCIQLFFFLLWVEFNVKKIDHSIPYIRYIRSKVNVKISNLIHIESRITSHH